MKNISIHSLIGLTVLCMSSCTDDYTDWATPQANEQEAAITLPDFSASKVDDINLSNPGSSIKLFTLSNATLPEGYTLGNVRATDSEYKRRSGFVEYPMAMLNLPLLYQHNPQIFQKANIEPFGEECF